MTTTAPDAPDVPTTIDVAGASAPSRPGSRRPRCSAPTARCSASASWPWCCWCGRPARSTPFRLGNLGKYCCWAIAAVGIGLAWGRGGMLVMGQGVFFGLGGYTMAMHMKLEAAGPGNVPDFMQLYGDGTMPSWWEPFRSGPFTLFAIVALPALVSFVLGYAILKRRVKGAYFAILTQAMAVAFATLLIATIKQTGGFNGLNTFTTFFGQNLYDPDVKKNLYLIAAGLLIVCLVVVWQLYRSRFGELLVATRDAEGRVRFLGYDPANIKLVAFVVAADHGRASAGRCSPRSPASSRPPTSTPPPRSCCSPASPSAAGRRCSDRRWAPSPSATGSRRSRSSSRPTGSTSRAALFIVVMLLLPGGIASLCSKVKGLFPSRPPAAPARGHRGRGGRVTASFLGEDYLEVRDLTVDFDGFKAIDGVDITFLQGRLHFLIGPNGAGKTTLVDALTGLVQGTGDAKFRNHNLLDDEVAPDRAPGHRPDLPDRDGVRGAQRPAEPRHRRRACTARRWGGCGPGARCPRPSRRRWRRSA